MLHEQQQLIWLAGEALCVTPAFAAELGGHLPSWLETSAIYAHGRGVRRRAVELGGNRVAHFVQRSCRRPLAWLSGVLRGQRPTSTELAQAALLFRLQRHGIAGPRLLAVGQKPQRFGRLGSFLLTETPAGTVRLPDWLVTASAERRRDALQQSTQLLRRLHAAGCGLRDGAALAIHIAGDQLTVLLADIDDVHRCRRVRREAG